jgi:hypothetical protein
MTFILEETIQLITPESVNQTRERQGKPKLFD